MKLMATANNVNLNSMRQIDMNYFNMILSQASRLMSVYQSGMLTISKCRQGGKQEVIVQHIQVTGDKAIVSGKINTLPAGGKVGLMTTNDNQSHGIVNFQNKPRCGAKSRSGKPCKNLPAKGKKRCRFHGGLMV